jgi:predicted nucleic acid-binding Zn finger protein
MLGGIALHGHQTVITGFLSMKNSSDPLSYYKVFGSRFNAAWTILKENRVYRIIPENSLIYWVVRGDTSDYVVYPNSCYCSCTDYYIHVINGEASNCKHLIAQKLAESLYKYKTIQLDKSENKKFCTIFKRSIQENSEIRLPFLSSRKRGGST